MVHQGQLGKFSLMIMEVERTSKADNGKNLIPSRSLSEKGASNEVLKDNACIVYHVKSLPDE